MTLDLTRKELNDKLLEHFAREQRNNMAQFGGLAEAIGYSLGAGGKRIRAMLVVAACEACDGDRDAAVQTGIAIEYLHCYSLIHDDLPALDNDDLRRGRPTSHKRFGEATAILAGDALQSLCFTTLGQLATTHRDAIQQQVAQAALAMVGGQYLDITAELENTDAPALERIHRNKTAALIRASLAAGGLCATQIDPQQKQALAEMGSLLGLAFQITDDLLEHSQTSKKLGKSNFSDRRNAQPTYPIVLGEEASRALVAQYDARTRACLQAFSPEKAGLLSALCDYLLQRTH